MGNLRLGAQHVAAQASTPLRPIDYYRNNYIYLPSPSYLTPEMQPMTLGDRENPTCRFCGQEESAVSFSHQAHAIPASLGNKCLFSIYECNECNQYFGSSIENDLGNWSIVNRTLSGIRGRRKVPTLKSGGHEPSWKITRAASGLRYKEHNDCSVVQIDEENKAVSFQLTGGSYTPIAVFKAFARIVPEAGGRARPDGERYELFVAVLELVRVEALLPYFRGQVGRPGGGPRGAGARLHAKAVFDIPTTRGLIERLGVDGRLCRLCGWSGAGRLPSEATFSRAFSEFAEAVG